MDEEQDLRPKYASPLMPVALLAGLAISGYWAFVPEPGSPVPDGAIRNEKCGFAVMRLPDWNVDRNDAGPAFSDCGKGTLAEKEQNVTAFVMSRDLGYGAKAVASVFVSPLQLPGLREGSREEVVGLLEKDVARNFESVRTEASEIFEADGLSAVKWTFSGRTLAQKGGISIQPGGRIRRTAGTIATDVRAMAAVVPGRGRFYLLLFAAPAEAFEPFRKQFEWVLKTFRVIERPNRFQLLTGGRF